VGNRGTAAKEHEQRDIMLFDKEDQGGRNILVREKASWWIEKWSSERNQELNKEFKKRRRRRKRARHRKSIPPRKAGTHNPGARLRMGFQAMHRHAGDSMGPRRMGGRKKMKMGEQP